MCKAECVLYMWISDTNDCINEHAMSTDVCALVCVGAWVSLCWTKSECESVTEYGWGHLRQGQKRDPVLKQRSNLGLAVLRGLGRWYPDQQAGE